MENVTPLRRLRNAAGLSQAKLGKLAGTTGQQIDRLEKSARKLTKEWAERLAPVAFLDPAIDPVLAVRAVA